MVKNQLPSQAKSQKSLPNQKQNLGKLGEKLAQKLLQNKGFSIITTNFHTRFGEIDLICLDKGTLVFVEVKTRTSSLLGYPEEAVTKAKLKKIQKSAEIFLVKNSQFEHNPVRIDMVAIDLKAPDNETIRHYENCSG